MKPFLYAITLVFLLFPLWAYSTHNRAGEITYEHISGLRYRVKITTYTKASSTAADRNYLKIRWGDEPSNVTTSQLDSLLRSNGNGLGVVLLPNYPDVRMNEYIGEHTYSGPGTFVLQMEDPNRNEGVLNINTGPGGVSVSVMAMFAIRTVLVIRAGNFPANNSVYLDRRPIQDACIFQPWIHNPVAIDPDGDELRYSLVPCLGEGGVPLTTWQSPTDYTLDPNDTFEINPATGDIQWNVPLETGEYNVAILVEEYRNGLFMGSVLRDMQITVEPCANTPPFIEPIADKCVMATDMLTFMVQASDNGSIQSFSAQGEPMSAVTNLASFDGSPAILNATFEWTPQCQEVRLVPYQVSFIATDNGNPPLSYFETVRIQVVAPPVLNPLAQSAGNQMDLSWNVTPCASIFNQTQAAQVKYRIYRRNNLFGFEPDECELGVPEYTGYTYLGETTGVNSNTYTDSNVNYGGIYCYMVVTVWPDGSESYASEEFCDTIKKEVPVMTRVSVNITDITAGSDTVQWSMPSDLDVVAFPGPYHYKLYHTQGLGNPSNLIYQTPPFSSLEDGDSIYVHQAINTQDDHNSYRVEIYSESLNELLGTSTSASSVFLTLIPNDNQIELQMNFDVPWNNYSYNIYRKAAGETEFTLLGTSTETSYLDNDLVNNIEYCYKVEAFGTFNAVNILPVLINWSQEVCAEPYDRTPPCPPILSGDHECLSLLNNLLWTNPNNTCADDVTAYNIYYAPIEGQALELIATISNANDTTYIYTDVAEPFSIAGCFAVTALDSLNLWPGGTYHQNESAMSNFICLDNCPVYFLPNIFTPNGDGANDLFTPIEYRYIQDVDFKLYNRWGNLVFETSDPALNWSGTDKNSNNLCSDGVYYYVITVNTIRLSGIVPESFSGTVQLAGSKKSSANN